MVPTVLNLDVDKPFPQIIEHCHSILCRQVQSIDLLFPFVYLFEWQCFISCKKCSTTSRFKTAGTIGRPQGHSLDMLNLGLGVADVHLDSVDICLKQAVSSSTLSLFLDACGSSALIGGRENTRPVQPQSVDSLH